jgi:hypothetical protein
LIFDLAGVAQIVATHPKPLVLLCLRGPASLSSVHAPLMAERTGQHIEEVTPCTPW